LQTAVAKKTRIIREDDLLKMIADSAPAGGSKVTRGRVFEGS
jgi:hypothetical protein